MSGSAPIACGGGVVSDLFSERDRAAAMAIYSLGPLIGPGNLFPRVHMSLAHIFSVVGPIAGYVKLGLERRFTYHFQRICHRDDWH